MAWKRRSLDLLVTALVDKGLLKAGGKQRTDSTHVLAAVRDLNRLELAGESVRACVEAIAAAAPDWLAATIDPVSWAPLRPAGGLLAAACVKDQTRRPRGSLRPGRVRAAGSGVRP